MLKTNKYENNDKSTKEVSTENILASIEILFNYKLLSDPNIQITGTRVIAYITLY